MLEAVVEAAKRLWLLQWQVDREWLASRDETGEIGIVPRGDRAILAVDVGLVHRHLRMKLIIFGFGRKLKERIFDIRNAKERKTKTRLQTKIISTFSLTTPA